MTVRGKAAAALPGAAIAVALMPPLAALGILLERGNGHLARGAFLLFATNLFGIIVASAAVLSISRLAIHPRLTRRGRLAILIPLLIAIIVAYPLAQRTATSYQGAKEESVARSVLFPELRAQDLGIQAITVVRTQRPNGDKRRHHRPAARDRGKHPRGRSRSTTTPPGLAHPSVDQTQRDHVPGGYARLICTAVGREQKTGSRSNAGPGSRQPGPP